MIINQSSAWSCCKKSSPLHQSSSILRTTVSNGTTELFWFLTSLHDDVQGDDTCCWKCRTCGKYQKLEDEFNCKDCSPGFLPTEDHTECREIPEEFIDFRDTGAIVAMAVASFGKSFSSTTGTWFTEISLPREILRRKWFHFDIDCIITSTVKHYFLRYITFSLTLLSPPANGSLWISPRSMDSVELP